MISCVVASLRSRLLDLAVHRRRDAREQALEVLLVRHQLRILQRTQARRVRPSRWEKPALAVVVAVLRRQDASGLNEGRQSQRDLVCSASRKG